jgi:hypothetical protein
MLPFWLLIIPLSWVLIALIYSGRLRALWREPVLRYPVLVVESDDWGAGPLEQTQALDALRRKLRDHRDMTGRCPVMTIGAILGIVDTKALATSDRYIRITLDHAYFAPVLNALRAGISEGVFAPQLHGLEHYWPPALLKAAKTDAQIEAWLAGDGMTRSEDLPSHLQSRWVDASTLPSRPLSASEIDAATADETEVYKQIFDAKPLVAVPTTFIWNDDVERAWAAHGINCIVTPGTRYESRDKQSHPCGDGRVILNGERGQGGVMYLVRDNYFEPALGHRAERGLEALALQTGHGRPTLLETHRFNFLGDNHQTSDSLAELNRLLTEALSRYSELRFLSTQEIADAIAHHDESLIETDSHKRLCAWIARIRQLPRFWKLARFTGLAMPLWLLKKWAA